MAENFDLIFGQSAGSQYAWSDSDYQNGWETVGNTPPTAEQFDALQKRSDTKSQELNNRLSPLETKADGDSRQVSTAYSVGDMRTANGLSYGWFLECTVSGTTSASALAIPSPLIENDIIVDGTVSWKLRKVSSADGVPLGAILPLAHNGAVPSGYLLCDGAAYSRTALPDLFAAIGTDYGSGDGSTTFNVPDANQAKRFLQGDTVAGQTKSAGLPNITGNFRVGYSIVENAQGALGTTEYRQVAYGTNSISADTQVTLDASRSSSIYGNSTTVQPPALTTRYIIKAFDGQTADSALIDITQFENELGNKADRSLSNLTDAGKSFSFPSDTYVTLPATWNNDGGGDYSTQTFVAPSDGFAFCRETSSALYDLRIRDLNNDLGAYVVVNNNNAKTIECFLPIKKGDSYKFYKVGNSGAQICRFYYAAGEVPA